MKWKTLASLLVISLCFLVSASPVYAQETPLPHAFYGTVQVGGEPADVGTEVEARDTEVLTGIEGNPITVTPAGKYGGPGGLDPKLVVQGDIENGTPIEFYVGEVKAECYDVEAGGEWLDSYPFKSGDVTELNLRVGAAPPPEPDIDVSPTEIDFGEVAVDLSSSETLTVYNVGNATLTITDMTISGPDSEQFSMSPYPETIPAGHSAGLQLTFSPTSTGTKSATLAVISDDPDEATVEVPLSGDGVVAPPPPELVADAGGPYSGTAGSPVSLSGSATGGTTPYSYAWDLDNDGAYDDSYIQNPSHTWADAGDYTVGLKVTDAASDTDTDTASVDISAAPPPPVGGTAYPANTLTILAPWIAIGAAIIAGAAIFIRRRRTQS